MSLNRLHIGNSDYCHICGLFMLRRGKMLRVSEAAANDLRRSIDHVLPRSLGGRSTPDNLLPAHRYCNMAKSSDEVTPALRERLRTFLLTKYGPVISDKETKTQLRRALYGVAKS